MSGKLPGAEPGGATESSPTSESAVEALVASLRRDGGSAEAGEFSVDREVARAKLRDYQLTDPRHYVLKWAQAAVRQGATRIRFDIDTDDVRVSFDGDPFTLEDFTTLYGALFSRSGGRERGGLHPLAIACNAVMSLEPNFVRVRSGDGAIGAVLELRPGRADAYQADVEPIVGTRIHVRSPWSADVVARVAQNARGRLPEEALLRERCRYAPVEIDLEGEIISGSTVLPHVAAGVPFEADGVRGECGFDPSLGERSEVRFLMDGIWVSTHALGGLPDGFLAVVEGAGLRLDLSESTFIHDAAFEQVTQAVETARMASILALADLVKEAPRHAELDVPWARRLLRQALRPSVDRRAFMGAFRDKLAVALATVELWPALDEGGRKVVWRSLEWVFARLDEGQTTLGYFVLEDPGYQPAIQRAARLNHDTEVCLVAPSEGDGRYLARLLGERLQHLVKHEAAAQGAVKQGADQADAEVRAKAIVWWVTFLTILGVIGIVAASNLGSPDCDQRGIGQQGAVGDARVDGGRH